MGIIRRYRLPALIVLVVLVIAAFLGFFFVFLLAPIVPLGLFYLGYLFTRERSARREGQAPQQLLDHEAELRRTELARDGRTSALVNEP
jgi:hypothetical protein